MKPTKVVFIEKDLEDSFKLLDESDPIKRALIKAIKDLQEDAYCGRNVKKNLIPKQLIQKYDLNNLWIYNLSNGWRMIYTLTNSRELEIISLVLDWMDHKDYEKLFKF